LKNLHIACTNNHGVKYLQVQESYSERINGKLFNRKRIIRNIGPLSRFDDGKPDYLQRLRQSFAQGEPIIESLSDLADTLRAKNIRIAFNADSDDDAFCSPRNIGYFLLDSLYDTLGIYDVLNLYSSRRGLGYDLNGLAKLLTFGRVLAPDSKIGTFESRGQYLFGVTSSEDPAEIYRAFDCLNEKAESIQKRMNLKITQSIGRNTEMCYYDVTNYYFEIGENDPDETDEDGHILKKGLRKKGVSKEKRGEPIVQMGLFIDDNGIPIAYRLFPGNNTDQTTLRPALEKTVDTMKLGRVIVVADGGLNSGSNISHLLDSGNGYILSRSTKKSDKETKTWMLDKDGYIWNENKTVKVKSILRKRKIKDAAGKMREIAEKLVCYWSKKHYDREVHENEKFIEYLNSVIENPDKLKDKQKKIEKFLVERQVDKETGEIIDTQKHLSIDRSKVQEYLDLLGYYTIMTSETDKTDQEIIRKYHGLSRIEDSFRITKSDLEGRPVFVRTPEHINAHFLTCFIALTMLRLIQYKILKSRNKDTRNENGWESGLSAGRIQAALASWQADALPGGYYRLTKPDNDLRLILDAFGIDGVLRLPGHSDVRRLKFTCDTATLP
jgi:transposase